MKKGDKIPVYLESLSGDGLSIGHYEGIAVFVEGGVPGDQVIARIVKIKKNYLETVSEQISSFSKYRTDPRCKHFGTCGGCKWQNLSYDAQIEYKKRIVTDAFIHIGGFENPPVLPTIACENNYFYRNKMEYTFSNYRWLTQIEIENNIVQEKEVALGLHTPGRYFKVLNIEECFLQSIISADILRTVREECNKMNLTVYSTKTHQGYLRHLVIRDGKRTGECMVNIVTSFSDEIVMHDLTAKLLDKFPGITTIVNNITDRKAMVAFGDSEKIYFGLGYINEKLGKYNFRISSNSFFQTNTLQAEKLYTVVKEFAELKSSDTVYDLYSGTGTIAIYISDAVNQVVGIDSIESARKDAQINASLNNVSNCYFYLGDIKDKLTREIEWQKKHPHPSVIILDPPRSGVHPKGIEEIIKIKPERIVYVSCNPSTQARDAKLLKQGGYELVKLQPVDMFPHTDHIETVALFRI